VSRAIGTIEESDVVVLLVDALEGFAEQTRKSPTSWKNGAGD